MIFSRFKIVLEEQADAVRAFLAVADCVEAITVAQDDLKVFIPRSESQAAARARLPVAALGKTGQIIQVGGGGLQSEIKAMRVI